MRLHTTILSVLALLALTFAANAGGDRTSLQTVATQFAFIDDGAGSVQLPGFNPALGTLQSVQIGVEVDGTFEMTVTADGSDIFATSWAPAFAGSAFPPAKAEGSAGYSRFGLIATRPDGGVTGVSSLGPVRIASLLPGVPTVISDFVDGNPAFTGPPVTDPEILAEFTGGTVTIPVATTGAIYNVGNSQGTISTNCSAVGRIYIRYFYN